LTTTQATDFDRATHVVANGDGRYAAALDPQWNGPFDRPSGGVIAAAPQQLAWARRRALGRDAKHAITSATVSAIVVAPAAATSERIRRTCARQRRLPCSAPHKSARADGRSRRERQGYRQAAARHRHARAAARPGRVGRKRADKSHAPAAPPTAGMRGAAAAGGARDAHQPPDEVAVNRRESSMPTALPTLPQRTHVIARHAPCGGDRSTLSRVAQGASERPTRVTAPTERDGRRDGRTRAGGCGWFGGALAQCLAVADAGASAATGRSRSTRPQQAR
jgi:hypothetical protein